MTALRILAFALLVATGSGCSSPSAQQRTQTAELDAVASLKQQYPGVVMGFDLKSPDMLVVSVDLQGYIDMDDDAVAAMQHAVMARWREAWKAANPGQHGVLRVRFIDFIGRKVAEESTNV